MTSTPTPTPTEASRSETGRGEDGEWDGATLETRLRSWPAAPPGSDAMSSAYVGALMAEAASTLTARPVGEDALRDAFRHVDDHDWNYLLSTLGYGGRARFWHAVFVEARAALANPTQPAAGQGAGGGWQGIQADEARIAAWVSDRFGPESLSNPMERADRLLEEAIEMQQAIYGEAGGGRQGNAGERRALAMVRHVYSKEPGDPRQEMGGVMTCALALGHRLGVRLDLAAQTELTRIEGLSKAHFDKRHQAKVDAGVAAQHDRLTTPAPQSDTGEANRG